MYNRIRDKILTVRILSKALIVLTLILLLLAPIAAMTSAFADPTTNSLAFATAVILAILVALLLIGITGMAVAIMKNRRLHSAHLFDLDVRGSTSRTDRKSAIPSAGGIGISSIRRWLVAATRIALNSVVDRPSAGGIGISSIRRWLVAATRIAFNSAVDRLSIVRRYAVGHFRPELGISGAT